MKTGSKMIIIGCIMIVMELTIFLLYDKLLPWLFGILTGVFLIILGVFKNKGYFNKNYYMAIFSLIALWGLMLFYIYLFRTDEYLRGIYLFYIFLGLFIFLLIRFGVSYIHKFKKGNNEV